MLERLQISNIELGTLIEEVNKNLDIIAGDIISRPDLEGARKVTVEISIKPNQQSAMHGTINVPEIDWSVKYTVPGHKGMTTRAFVENGQLIINTGAPTESNPDQATIFDVPAVN